MRLPAHTDFGTITLVFQDECGGLEIEHPKKPGEFIRADPVKDAIVMNIGDLLMRWTNGISTLQFFFTPFPILSV